MGGALSTNVWIWLAGTIADAAELAVAPEPTHTDVSYPFGWAAWDFGLIPLLLPPAPPKFFTGGNYGNNYSR
jgi:hypothetical protein